MNIEEFKTGLSSDSNIKTIKDELWSDAKEVYPFDIPPLDIIFGGGLYSGKIYEIFGLESHGKSTIGLEAAKAFTKYWQKKEEKNYAILWIETESALDKMRAHWMGCDLNKFLISECETVEEGFRVIKDTLEKAEKVGFKVFIVWDTIAAAPTENEKAKGTYGGGMSEKARVIRAALKTITSSLGRTNSTLFFINQVYQIIGSYAGGVETPGGGGIKFHSSVRAQISRKEQITEIAPSGEEITKGIVSEIYTKKNKLTNPNQSVKLVIYGETGIDKIETVVRYLMSTKDIKVAGGWKKIDFNGEEISFQNMKSIKDIIEVKNPDLEIFMDYLVYKSFSTVSPLIKVKILKKLWDYEMKFFNEHRTQITDDEREIAKLIYKDLQEKDNNEINN